MAQSRIDAFTVSRTAACTERAHRLVRMHELEAQRRRIAEALCSEWPQARSKRRVGKPTRQRKWTEHICSDRPFCLQVPSWCQSGGIVPPEPEALTDHVMSSRQRALGGISSEAEAAAHAAEEAPPKRKKSIVRPEAGQFYLEHRDFMVGRGLTAQVSFRQLQHIAPELYGDVDERKQKMETLWRTQAL